MKKTLLITLVLAVGFVKAAIPEQDEMLTKIKASQIAYKERMTKLLGHPYTTLTIKDKGDICIKDTSYCGDYIASVVENALGNMDRFAGASIGLQVILDDQANIKTIEVIKRCENMEFGKYVLNNIYKSGPFSALLSLPKEQFEIHQKINITLRPFKLAK